MAQTRTTKKNGSKTRHPSKISAKGAQSQPQVKSATSKRNGVVRAKSAGDEEVTIDRRRGERRKAAVGQGELTTPSAPPLERRQKVNRRRQIDPTTCERDYTEQEVEFMNALDAYKRQSGRMFPTCSEVLEVLRSLGYVKLSPAELAALPEAVARATSAKPMPSDLGAKEPAPTEALEKQPMETRVTP